jgi:hypothetical protein
MTDVNINLHINHLKILKYVLILFLFSLMNLSVGHAQWVQTNGPDGGKINCFAVIGTNTFAGTGDGRIFLSTYNGTSWTEVNNNLTATLILSLTLSDTNLFAGTYAHSVWRLPFNVIK